jgi:hypothetical protein
MRDIMYFFIKIIRPLLKAQKKYKPKNVCLPLTHVSGLFGIRPLVAFCFFVFFGFFFHLLMLNFYYMALSRL